MRSARCKAQISFQFIRFVQRLTKENFMLKVIIMYSPTLSGRFDMADIPNYTDPQPLIQISEIKFS